jgi:anti-anti-sigma regulatory factor
VPSPPPSWRLDTLETGSLLAVTGRFGPAAGDQLCQAALRVLDEGTGALIIDLSAMTTLDDAAGALFAAVLDRADEWPGTPAVLCAVPPDHRLAGLVARRPPNVFGTVTEARAALAAEPAPEPIRTELLPAWGAARHARNVVTEACLRWRLAHLLAPAVLIATELVVNAAEHASTVMTLDLRLGRRYFYVAVHDGTRLLPAPARPGSARGRGLRLVDSQAWRWGHRLESDGKVVWCALARAPQ